MRDVARGSVINRDAINLHVICVSALRGVVHHREMMAIKRIICDA